MKPYKSHHDDLMEDLKNPLEAVGYLNAALEDGDKRVFLVALRDVLEAQGGLSRFSRLTRLHRVSLHKMLSKEGNPNLESLWVLLEALGARLRLSAEPRKRAA